MPVSMLSEKAADVIGQRPSVLLGERLEVLAEIGFESDVHGRVLLHARALRRSR